MLRALVLIFSTLASLSLLSDHALCQTREAPYGLRPKTIKKISLVTTKLATAGCRQETKDLLGFLEQWGEKRDRVEKLRTRCATLLAKSKKRNPRPSLVREVMRIAHLLTTAEKEIVPAERVFRAKVALFFDSMTKKANETLGRELREGVWVSSEKIACSIRRIAIYDAMRRARKLEIPITFALSKNEIITKNSAKPAVVVSAFGVTVHTTYPRYRAERFLRNALQTLAFSNFVLTGKLEIPPMLKSEWIFFDSTVPYRRAAKTCIAEHRMNPVYALIAMGAGGYFQSDGVGVFHNVSENSISANLFRFLRNSTSQFAKAQPVLQSGHLNWATRVFLGVPIGPMLWLDDKSGARLPREYDRTPARDEKKIRRLLIRMSATGIAGSRAYVEYLAEKGELPPFSELLIDQVGRLNGINLLKVIHVFEYLQERGDAASIMIKSRTKDARKFAKELAKTLGPLEDFDERWEDWLIGQRPGLAQRLAKKSQPLKLGKEETELLRYLNDIRQRSDMSQVKDEYVPVVLVDSLSIGCQKHALYLKHNPKQLDGWPDASEEYVDKKGFSVEGCWAGQNSIIAPGARNAKRAIDSWLGTFFHRLHLLEPGLIGIGFGNKNGVAVLDAGSLVDEWQTEWTVVWPGPDMKAVPRRFNSELPNPLPGSNQSEWGYPITIQRFNAAGGRPRIGMMRLHLGTIDGPIVPCHLSTPAAPLNPDLAPPGAFCLIPKQHLAANQKYTVVGELEDSPGLIWSFMTAVE